MNLNHPTSSKFRAERQMTVRASKAACEFCSRIDLFRKLMKTCIEPLLLKHCQCTRGEEENCCCTDKISNLLSNDNVEKRQDFNPETVVDSMSGEQVLGNIFSKYDTLTKTKRYFCLKCIRFGTSRNTEPSEGRDDWVNTGILLCTPKWRMNQRIKRHLQSLEHKKSEEAERFKTNFSLPSDYERIKATENLCIGVQLMAEFNLPYRFWPYFCTTLSVMSKNLEGKETLNLVGNNNHSHNVVPKAQNACYEACRDVMKKELGRILPATGQAQRFQLSADKGTAKNDCSRQAIVETHIGSDGYPCEALVSVDAIFDATALGASEHFTKHVQEILNTNQIVAISADGAATCAGSQRGMFQILQSDQQHYSEKMQYLPDLCHRAELLMSNNNPDWVEEAIEASDSIILKVNSLPLLREVMLKYSDKKASVDFYAMQSTLETRCVEYLHKSLQSVLKNIQVMHLAFSSVIESSDYDQKTKQRAKSILSTISDPSLLAKWILINSVYVQVECMKKKAQAACFGSFDYAQSTSELKVALETTVNTANQNVLNIIKSGIFNYQYIFNGKKLAYSIDLNSSGNDRNESVEEREKRMLDVKTDYESWVLQIRKDFESYLQTPAAVDMAIQIFSLSEEKKLVDRVRTFREFFASINTEFEPCGAVCTGIHSCSCVAGEIDRFFQNVHIQLAQRHDDPWTRNNSGFVDASLKEDENIDYNYSAIFAHYLADINQKLRDELKIVNVLRAVEVVLLLKASQSATERAFSIVGRVVEGRYDNRYRLNKNLHDDGFDTSNTYPRDYVASAVFITMNSNIATLDATLARQKFIDAGHGHALLRTKPIGEPSKAVKTMLQKLTQSTTDQKRKIESKSNNENRAKRRKIEEKTIGLIQNCETITKPVHTYKDNNMTNDDSEQLIYIDIADPILIFPDLTACSEQSQNITYSNIADKVQTSSTITDQNRDNKNNCDFGNKLNWTKYIPSLRAQRFKIQQRAKLMKAIKRRTKKNIRRIKPEIITKEINTRELFKADETSPPNKASAEKDLSSNNEPDKKLSFDYEIVLEQKCSSDTETLSEKEQSSYNNVIPESSFSSVNNKIIPDHLTSDNKLPEKDNEVCEPLIPVDDNIKPVLMLRDGRIINQQDMVSVLEENRWLEQNIVSGFLSCFEQKDILVINDNEFNLITEGIIPSSINKDWKFVKKVLVGRYEPRHFVLYFFDMTSHQFYYLNTLRQTRTVFNEAASDILKIWNEFLPKVLTTSTSCKTFSLAKTAPTHHPFQLDSSSCGVLVCKMGQNIATGTPLSQLKADKRSIARYRKEIWDVLLKNKDREKCVYCRQTKDDKNPTTDPDRWVLCRLCTLWYHLSCAKISYDTTPDEVKSMLWECPYCLKLD